MNMRDILKRRIHTAIDNVLNTQDPFIPETFDLKERKRRVSDVLEDNDFDSGEDKKNEVELLFIFNHCNGYHDVQVAIRDFKRIFYAGITAKHVSDGMSFKLNKAFIREMNEFIEECEVNE